MSILDDAIREHLELKRAHGADEAELKRLEDEAFGPAERPGEVNPFAEAPTEFLGEPPPEAKGVEEEAGGRRPPNITDLQEAPPSPEEAPPEAEAKPPPSPEAEAPPAAEPAEAEAAPAGSEVTPAAEAEAAPAAAAEADTGIEELPAPAEEEHPAMEHETIPAPSPEPVADTGPSTEEREAIAGQPTELFDVEAELAPPAPAEAEPEREEEPVHAEPESAELEVPDEEESAEYEEDDFFSEQRLSDELNQALEAPVTDEHEALPELEPLAEEETPPPAHVEEATAVYDFEEEESGEPDAPDSEGDREDVLEDTPEFLEDAPEDDDLWFEQRPPKDFDFDD